jgi:spore coat polysaccharide biosynthesis predicted glycosyltransferase SpsG
LCIVCKKPTTEFEYSYINYIKDYLESINIKIFTEHNNVLTDYYIMKEAELLICSKSTLSWCAAFFSAKIQKCYLPDYIETSNSTCKYPIDNTELY